MKTIIKYSLFCGLTGGILWVFKKRIQKKILIIRNERDSLIYGQMVLLTKRVEQLKEIIREIKLKSKNFNSEK